MDIIESYREDLKVLRRQHQQIAAKRKLIKIKVLGKECQKIEDQRTDDERNQQKILASMISSTEYALYWLETGNEKKAESLNASIPKRVREQLWADVDECIKWQSKKNANQLFRKDSEDQIQNKEKELKLEQVNEILSVFSEREKELFLLRHTVMMSEEECAQKMGIAVGTVKSMSQRIRDKIDRYFEYGHQISLF